MYISFRSYLIVCESGGPLHHYKIFLCQFFHGEVPGERKHFTIQNVLWRREMKNQGIKIHNVAVLTSFFSTKMELENGVRKYFKVKVSKKEFRLQSPLAFVSMSVWTIWLARNMPLTKIWLLTFQSRVDFWLQLYLNINENGF